MKAQQYSIILVVLVINHGTKEISNALTQVPFLTIYGPCPLFLDYLLFEE